MSTSKPAKPMTVVITVEITLPDPEQWTTAFGIEGRAVIRQDVKQYVANQIRGEGVFGDGEVAAEVALRNP
jgi:hypothetical protein